MKKHANGPVIELENVEKTYLMGEVEVSALRGISLSIRENEFVAIMGPSGSGKSTLMNMVGCLDTPTVGAVRLDGQDISHLGESHLAQIRGRKIGFVFQQFNLIGSLSAFENIELPLVFQGIPEDERFERVNKLLNAFGLAERGEHTPSKLSGGEQQRVAICRALVSDPEVVLADEPTGNLDSQTGQEIISFLKQLHGKQKKTLIVVTHDAGIARHAQRIVLIKDGLIEKIVKQKKFGKR